MERRQGTAAASTPPADSDGKSDAVDDGASGGGATPEAGSSFFERHFRALLAALVVLGAAGGVAVTYTQYGRVAQAARALPFASGGGGGAAEVSNAPGEEGAEEGPKTSYGSFTQLKGRVVNPAGSGGGRYLAVGLAFETDTPAVVEELKAKEVVVRDAVLDLLSERTARELSATDQRDALKEELRAATNELLQRGTVERLYFTQFVLQ